MQPVEDGEPRVLDDILSGGCVGDEETGKPEQGRVVPVEDERECRLVAGEQTIDQDAVCRRGVRHRKCAMGHTGIVLMGRAQVCNVAHSSRTSLAERANVSARPQWGCNAGQTAETYQPSGAVQPLTGATTGKP